MWYELSTFWRRATRMPFAPAQTCEEALVAPTYVAPLAFGWIVGAFVWRWVGEALWPTSTLGPAHVFAAFAACLVPGLLQITSVHFFARLLGGKGSWLAFAALGNYMLAPALVVGVPALAVFALWVRVTGPVPFSLAGFFLYLACVFAFMLTGLVIYRHVLGAVYGLGGRRAWSVAIVSMVFWSAVSAAVEGHFVPGHLVSAANRRAMGLSTPPLAFSSDREAARFQLTERANRRALAVRRVARGDVVIVEARGGASFVVRVLGLPGEDAGTENGRLIVNGTEQEEPWHLSGDLTITPRRLGPDEFFVWTDDRSSNLVLDSHHRLGGFVNRASLSGPPLLVDEVLPRALFGDAGR